MNNTFSYTISVPIKYNEIPNNLVFIDQPPTTFDITIQETGKVIFDLIFENRIDSISVTVDHNWKQGKNEIIINKKDINWSTFDNALYHYFNKNTFEINLDSIATKTVRVNSAIDLLLGNDLTQVGKVHITEDNVLISGPKTILDKITNLTPLINKKAITTTGLIDLRLKLDNSSNIDLEIDSVSAQIEVQNKENMVIDNVPVNLINAKPNDSIILNPATVSLVVVGGDKILENLSSKDFNLFIDYSTVNLKEIFEIKPRITSFKELEEIKCYPNTIKIIRKKNE